MIRRILFFLVLISFTLLNLMPLFRGLSSPQAMEQAQIAWQIARGEGFTTKMIRPLAYYREQIARKIDDKNPDHWLTLGELDQRLGF